MPLGQFSTVWSHYRHTPHAFAAHQIAWQGMCRPYAVDTAIHMTNSTRKTAHGSSGTLPSWHHGSAAMPKQHKAGRSALCEKPAEAKHKLLSEVSDTQTQGLGTRVLSNAPVGLNMHLKVSNAILTICCKHESARGSAKRQALQHRPALWTMPAG